MIDPEALIATPYHPDELAQMRRFASWTFAEKVRWLEEAHRLALALRPVDGAGRASYPDRDANPEKEQT